MLFGLRERAIRYIHLRQVVLAAAAAVTVMALKAGLVAAAWHPVAATNLLPALMGGVMFTLAIVLSGVLSDFREAERSVGEIASQVRRLHWDVAFIGADRQTVDELRAQLRAFLAALLSSTRGGRVAGVAQVRTALDTIDRTMAARVPAPTGPVRTVQTGLASILRMVDRLHVIVGTTFLQAGHAFAGSAIALLLVGFLASDLGPAQQAVPLVGVTAFILIGLFLLVRELDNPFNGSVHVGLEPLEEVQRFLDEEAAAASATPVVSGGEPAPPPALTLLSR